METKICKKCKKIKDINNFTKRCKDSKDGLSYWCKECSKNQYLINRNKLKKQRNSDEFKLKQKLKNQEWHLKNPNASKEYYNKNKDKKNKYYLENKDYYKAYGKEYNLKNKLKLQEKNKLYWEINKNNHFIYVKNRIKIDPIFKLSRNINSLINITFKKRGNIFKKSKRTEEILGCSFEELFNYFESRFESWMTWENKGLYNGEFNFGWDIDHIIPISSAKSEEDIYRLNHFTNLQPLCSKINRDIKRNLI